jgi:hypothetical protein
MDAIIGTILALSGLFIVSFCCPLLCLLYICWVNSFWHQGFLLFAVLPTVIHRSCIKNSLVSLLEFVSVVVWHNAKYICKYIFYLLFIRVVRRLFNAYICV